MVRAFLFRGLAIAITLLIVVVLQLATRESGSDLESQGDFRATRLWLPFHINTGPAFTATLVETTVQAEEPQVSDVQAGEKRGIVDQKAASIKRTTRARCNNAPES